MKKHIALLLGLLLAACNGTAVTTTTTGGGTTTTTTAPATTTTSAAPGTTASEPPEGASVFFLHDSGGNRARSGPFVYPVHRDVATGADEVAVRVEALLEGPTPEEEEFGISTAIPEGTELLGVEREAGVASIDLSAEFESGGGSASMVGRLAQLVFTATAVEGVEAVELRIEGQPVETFSGEGIVLEGPQTREHYQDSTPGILVEDPAFRAPVSDPLEISGTAAAFEGVFQLEVQDAEGNVLAGPPFVQAEGGTGWFPFQTAVDLPDDAPGELVIHVWEASAEDGSPVSERYIPVDLVP